MMALRPLPRVGPVLVALFFLLAIFGPLLAPQDPEAIDLLRQFEGPSAAHWLGTGDNGVDLLSVLLHGARLAGVIALWVVLASALVGMTLGSLAGYVGGRLDHLLSGVMDLVQSFPGILLNIAILALVARPGVIHLVVALAIPGWVLYARLARAEALILRNAEYVQAARAIGAGPARVLFRHVMPEPHWTDLDRSHHRRGWRDLGRSDALVPGPRTRRPVLVGRAPRPRHRRAPALSTRRLRRRLRHRPDGPWLQPRRGPAA